jgi:23S rRNA G2069 N7-methylase RlmK/C1962 C5-methylase RlmI
VAELVLKPGREKSLLRRHPWIFSGAVQQVDALRQAQGIESGETVDLLSFKGEFLARAAYSPHSQIRARVWTFDTDERVDPDFFRRRIRAAIQSRAMLGYSTTEPTENTEKKNSVGFARPGAAGRAGVTPCLSGFFLLSLELSR